MDYTRDQVFRSALQYFNNDELAANVWINKYALKNGPKYVEISPKQMHERMAKHFAEVESSYKKSNSPNCSDYYKVRAPLTEQAIFELFDKFKYVVPQGSVMSLLGNPYQIGSLSNCMVIKAPYDSFGGIFFTDQQLAQLMKRRCGVGVDVSSLRPESSSVNNAALTSSGAVSFMHRFSNTCREVAQQGRRGALMLTMDVRHPDIEKFIDLKLDLSKVTGANISIKLSDEFLKAVEKKKNFLLRWPVDSETPQITKEVNAKAIWDKIVFSVWKCAEPGLLFWDRQHVYSTSSFYPDFVNEGVNPCAEIAMGIDSCRLIIVNLMGFIKDIFTEKASFDFDHYYKVVYEAQRLIDDLVDLEIKHIDEILKKIEKDPEPDMVKEIEKATWEKIRSTCKAGRRTGLGFNSLADTLAGLNIKFDSEEALKFTNKIMKIKCNAEWQSSIDMAIERGRFEAFDPEIEEKSEFIQMLKKELPEVYERNMKFGRRNISISTCAPTGSVSILTQTSSGIEPVFELQYKRRTKVNPEDKNVRIDFVDETGDSWQEHIVLHRNLQLWKDVTKKDSIEKSPYWKATAKDIDWQKRVELQGIVQKWITHSISSTINLPKEITKDEVSNIYLQSWKEGLKGITIYVEGSRDGVLISTNDSCSDIKQSAAPKRPEILTCDIHYSKIQSNEWVFFVGLLGNCPYEIFGGTREQIILPNKFKNGWIKKIKSEKSKSVYDLYLGSLDESNEKLVIKQFPRVFGQERGEKTRLISVMLRHGIPIKFICEQLQKSSDHDMFTFEKGISRVLKKYIKDGEKASDKCDKCGSELQYKDGCAVCMSCGESKCS